VRTRVFPARKGSRRRWRGRRCGYSVRRPSVGRSWGSVQLGSVQFSSGQFNSGQFRSVQCSALPTQRGLCILSLVLYPVLYPVSTDTLGEGRRGTRIAGRPMSRQQQQQWSNGEMPRAGCMCRRGWDWTGRDRDGMGWVRGRERDMACSLFPPSYGNGNWV
jgi:hypothetical protein